MEKPKHGIAVDGSCLGNPGFGEYRGIDIATGKELFRLSFQKTTNNLMEFFAICHALKYRKDNGLNSEIYSDSQVAISWIKSKDVSTTLVRDKDTELSYEMLQRSLMWLVNNLKNHLPLSKWQTDVWGENPADFGRKGNGVKSEVKIESKDSNLKIEAIECITKDELRNFIQEEWNKPMPDITTLARLAQRFNINIENK